MRLVSLCPSLTELVFDLGRGAELVGITDWCVHPADHVGAIEKVGGTKTPDVERIAALRPDLVLMNEEENRIEDAEALRARGVRLNVSMPRDCADTARMVRGIAADLDRREAGVRIADDIEQRARRVRAAAANQRAVRFAYLIWRQPWMSVSADTFASSLLTQAGGVNVFSHSPERYPAVEIERLAAEKPDALFLCTEPFPFQDRHRDELAKLCGLPRERIAIADGEFLSWHGSRTPDGIDYAERLIVAARRTVFS